MDAEAAAAYFWTDIRSGRMSGSDYFSVKEKAPEQFRRLILPLLSMKLWRLSRGHSRRSLLQSFHVLVPYIFERVI